MEYCSNCRAIRPTRKSTKKRSVRQPDGSMKTVLVDSYHCARCNHFVGSVERDATPERAPAPAETEEPVEVGAADDHNEP
jgi:hypothetical protein